MNLRPLMLNVCSVGGRQILAGVLQLLIVAIVGRALGPEGLGVFSIALVIPALLTTLLSFGLGPANTYYLATRKYETATVWAATKLVFLFSVVLGTLLAVIYFYCGGKYFTPGVTANVFAIATVVFVPMLLVSYMTSIFAGLHDFHRVNALSLFPSMTGFCLNLLLWLAGHLNVSLAVATFAVGNLLGAAWGWYVLKAKYTNEAVIERGLVYVYITKAVSYGIKAHVGNLIAFCNYKVNLVLVNAFLGSGAAGIFALALRLAEQLLLIAQSATTVLFPKVASLENEAESQKWLTALVSRTVLWLSLISGGLLMLMAKPLVLLVAGESFANSATVTLVLVPGVILLACGKVLGSDTAARGLVHLNVYLALLMLATSVGLSLLLIPYLGVVGAALATSVAYAIDLAARLVLQQRIAGTSWKDLMVPRRHDVATLLRSA